MATKSLAAGESIIIDIPDGVASVAGVTTGASNATDADVELQIEGIADEWMSISLVLGLARTVAAKLTGVSKYGWAEVYGVKRVRAKRTDSNGGVCVVNIDANQLG